MDALEGEYYWTSYSKESLIFHNQLQRNRKSHPEKLSSTLAPALSYLQSDLDLEFVLEDLVKITAAFVDRELVTSLNGATLARNNCAK